MQSVGQKKTKTFCEHCNATITRALNNYKSAHFLFIYLFIFQIKVSFFLFIFFLFVCFFCYVNLKLGGFLVNIKTAFSPLALVGVRLSDNPLRWNFCRRFPTRDLS